MKSEERLRMDDIGILFVREYIFADPMTLSSTTPEMHNTSRYFATELRLISMAWEISVTVYPLALPSEKIFYFGEFPVVRVGLNLRHVTVVVRHKTPLTTIMVYFFINLYKY